MKSSRAAFTLIELLVVIAIIAVLIGLIFMFSRGALGKAAQVKSLNNMRQVGNGLLLYTSDHDGQFPPRALDGDNRDRWPKLVNEYLRDPKVFAAPEDKQNYLRQNLDPISNSQNNTSYIMNGGWDPGVDQATVNERPLRLVAIQEPSKTILVTAVFNDENFYLDVHEGDQNSVLNPRLFGGKSNSYVFMDGSARTIPVEEYREMSSEKGGDDYIWLINKDAQ
jgi:prepilin-type N-terminal cleavage/methylation domain-containing protein